MGRYGMSSSGITICHKHAVITAMHTDCSTVRHRSSWKGALNVLTIVCDKKVMIMDGPKYVKQL